LATLFDMIYNAKAVEFVMKRSVRQKSVEGLLACMSKRGVSKILLEPSQKKRLIWNPAHSGAYVCSVQFYAVLQLGNHRFLANGAVI
jgi:hypothetical protein